MIKKLIQAIVNKNHSQIKECVNSILMTKLSKALTEKSKKILVRQGKRVRKFQRVKGKHVDAKTGVEKRITGAEAMKFKKAGIKAARKGKGKRSVANVKRKRSMAKKF